MNDMQKLNWSSQSLWQLLLVGLITCLCSCSKDPIETAASQPDAAPLVAPATDVWTDSTSTRRALLIGCTRYPNLHDDYQLLGPSNDVQLTADLLRNPRFGFNENDIATLVYENPPDSQPTLENISRYFELLCDRVSEGDDVFVFLAGHGAQQPNLNAEDDIENDGLDEVFVPQDVQSWNRNDQVESRNVIVDDQIETWLNRIRAKGAFVLLVADTCHAGSIDRGHGETEDTVRSRRLPPIYSTFPLTSEDSELATNKERVLLESKEGYMALFAVPSQFAEQEELMPPQGRAGGSVTHGRLTYALNKILRTTRRPLTYRELQQQLRLQYDRWGWSVKPLIEGEHIDRSVLGREQYPGRSFIELRKSAGGEISLNLGRLHNVYEGSIFRVFPASGSNNDEEAIGYVKVTKANIDDSIVEPVDYSDTKTTPTANFPDLATGELVFRDLGDAKLPVFVKTSPELTNKESYGLVKRVVENICADPKSMVAITDDEAAAELFVVVDDGSAVLKRKYDEISGSTDESGTSDIPEFTLDNMLEKKLNHALNTVARAINLVRLSELEQETNGDDEGVELEFKLAVKRNGEDEFSDLDLNENLQFKDLDVAVIWCTNKGNSPIDLTALYVETGFSIKSFRIRLEPYNDADSPRIPPGESRCIRIKIRDYTTGRENMVLIAVPAKNTEVTQFKELGQQGWRDPESEPPSVTRGGRSDYLEQLIDSQFFGITRSIGQPNVDAFAMQQLSWTVVGPDQEPVTPDADE